ncbi:S41 family peptidase [Aquimarina hainanensis]|uniref:S41 family peptidase n=1 Tax=Aquimarina hainanensis TaxID=1578017 RepID=A0ABW5N9Q2_9FLAO
MKNISVVITFFLTTILAAQSYNDLVMSAEEAYRNKAYEESILFYKKAFDTSEPQLLNKKDMYNAACSAALSDRKELAISYVYKAVDMGWDNYHHLIKDSDLKSLYEEEPWRELLSKINDKHQRFLNSRLNKEQVSTLVTDIIAKLEQTYFDKEKSKKVKKVLLQQIKDKELVGMTPPEIAKKIKETLRNTTNDIHFYMGVKEIPAAYKTGKIKGQKKTHNKNGGFSQVSILDENIGYIKWDTSGVDLTVAFKKVIAMLEFLDGCDSLIFDITSNGGGYGELSGFINQHLFATKEYQHLLKKRCIGEKEWHQSEVPYNYTDGPNFFDVPVYVMVSENTGSSAEYFAFILQQMKRATIVGKTTAGAGNPVTGVSLKHYNLYIPICEIKTKEGKSIEAKGVVPDIELKSDNWLKEVTTIIKNK